MLGEVVGTPKNMVFMKIIESEAEFRFVATVATDARVKFVPAV